MELKLESGLPHQEYAVEAISEVFKQVEINQQVAHYSNPVIDLRSNRFITNKQTDILKMKIKSK